MIHPVAQADQLQGGLAAPGRSQQHHQLTGVQLQVHSTQRLHLARQLPDNCVIIVLTGTV